MGKPQVLYGLSASLYRTRWMKTPSTDMNVNKLRVNPTYSIILLKDAVKISARLINDCKRTAITGVPLFDRYDRKRRRNISSPMVCETLGPTNTMELIVETNKMEISMAIIFPPIWPKMNPEGHISHISFILKIGYGAFVISKNVRFSIK